MLFSLIGTMVLHSFHLLWTSEQAILFGILLFILVILPVLIIRDVRHRRKIRKIIQSHRDNKLNIAGEDHLKNKKTKGWGMNNSPFRSRKSGLSWGGGNVHASHADRGTRRKPSR